MISSNAFNYINVLNKAADAAWLRNDVISNNIANASTPNYKRKDVQFQTYLMEQLAGADTLDEGIGDIELDTLNATTYVDNSSLSYRADGNNVDIDTENAEFAKNQITYSTLMDSMTQEFSRIRMVLDKA